MAWGSAPRFSSAARSGENSLGWLQAPRAAAMSGGPKRVGLLVGAGGSAGPVAGVLWSPVEDGMMRSAASSTMPISAADWLRSDVRREDRRALTVSRRAAGSVEGGRGASSAHMIGVAAPGGMCTPAGCDT